MHRTVRIGSCRPARVCRTSECAGRRRTAVHAGSPIVTSGEATVRRAPDSRLSPLPSRRARALRARPSNRTPTRCRRCSSASRTRALRTMPFARRATRSSRSSISRTAAGRREITSRAMASRFGSTRRARRRNARRDRAGRRDHSHRRPLRPQGPRDAAEREALRLAVVDARGGPTRSPPAPAAPSIA